MRMIAPVKYICSVMGVFALLLMSGCDGQQPNASPDKKPPVVQQKPDDNKDKPDTTAGKNTQEKKEYNLTLYYPNDDGTKLIAVTKKTISNEKDKYRAAVEALMTGGDNKNIFPIIPRQAKLNSAVFNNGVVTLDFSADLKKHFVGGSTGEEMLIGSIVNTLTEFKEVKAVEFLLDGKKIESLAGHSDLTKPVERMENLLK